MHVVTLSATFGALGGLIGPSVAEELGVPFVDRAIPMVVAEELGVPFEQVACRDEQVRSWLTRMLESAAPLCAEYMLGPEGPGRGLLRDEEFVARTRTAIHKVSASGGVILGRAAAIVLRDHPTALHVRLDGDPERRIRQAREHLVMDEDAARESQRRNDTGRAAYVQHYYRTDPADPRLYHLVLDSTRFSPEVCTEIIVSAARNIDRVGGPS